MSLLVFPSTHETTKLVSDRAAITGQELLTCSLGSDVELVTDLGRCASRREHLSFDVAIASI